jgi:hypothetical protein
MSALFCRDMCECYIWYLLRLALFLAKPAVRCAFSSALLFSKAAFATARLHRALKTRKKKKDTSPYGSLPLALYWVTRLSRREPLTDVYAERLGSAWLTSTMAESACLSDERVRPNSRCQSAKSVDLFYTSLRVCQIFHKILKMNSLRDFLPLHQAPKAIIVKNFDIFQCGFYRIFLNNSIAYVMV